jgi:TRAP-type uncharacterized transport system substrate-binding protein
MSGDFMKSNEQSRLLNKIDQVCSEEIDAMRVVVNGLANANVRDVEHMYALQRIARTILKSEKEKIRQQ